MTDEAKFLAESIAFVGCVDPESDEEECRGGIGDAMIEWGDVGYDGPGWYMWCSEYPDEGSVCVSNERKPFPELAAALKLQDERDATSKPGEGTR